MALYSFIGAISLKLTGSEILNMEIFVMVLMFAMPIAFLVWSLKFKGIFSLLALAPLAMINVLVLSMNVGFDQNNPPAMTYTHNEILNQTAITSGGNTTTVNHYGQVQDNYVIGFKNMQILNTLVGVFTIIIGFVVFRRVTRYKKTDPDDKY